MGGLGKIVDNKIFKLSFSIAKSWDQVIFYAITGPKNLYCNIIKFSVIKGKN